MKKNLELRIKQLCVLPRNGQNFLNPFLTSWKFPELAQYTEAIIITFSVYTRKYIKFFFETFLNMKNGISGLFD